MRTSLDLDRMNSMKWIHCVDLGDGVETPGVWKGVHMKRFFDFANVDFAGRKVLDIGCFDGLFTFEAERRGAAQVWGVDDLSKRPGGSETFLFAKEVLGSAAVYEPHLSVYNLDRLGQSEFDTVMFLGVIYHLYHPLLGLSKIRTVQDEGGELLVESVIIHNDSTSSLRFFYHDHHVGDRSNWFVPTGQCLLEMIESCYYEVTHSQTYDAWSPPRWKQAIKSVMGRKEPLFARMCVRARAVRREDPNWIRRDEILGRFDPRWSDNEPV